MEQKLDLINLKNSLEFIINFEVELYEAIEVINKLQKMNSEEIKEWKLSLSTDFYRTHLDDFILILIDKYFQ